MKNKLAAIVLVTVVISAGLIMLTEAGASTATEPEEEWNKTFGGPADDSASSVQQTSDGGYIVAGNTYAFGAGSKDAWLIKTDSVGNEKWNKTFGGSGWDTASSVQQTPDGGYILAGTTYSSFGAGEEEGDVWLIKTDPLGKEEWNNTFGSSDYDGADSVQQTSDGGYIIAGETWSGFAGSSDALLIKTDPLGNEEWAKTFGGSDFDLASSVQHTSDGGYIVAAYTVSFGAESKLDYGDAWLIKTDPSGNEEWAKTFGGSDYDAADSVQQTSDGGYIIAADTWSGFAGSSDAWLIKTDSSGNEEWNKTFGGTAEDRAYSVQQTSDGGYIVAGNTYFGAGYKDARLIKTDPVGNEKWNKTFGGPADDDSAYSVQQTSDGGYIVAGYTESYGAGMEDAWLIKVGGKGAGTIQPEDTVPEVIPPDIERPSEKSIPGFGSLGAMFVVFVIYLLKRRRT